MEKSETIKKFLKEVSPFKQGCPTCGSPKINPEDFRDELSRKEFRISGMCQECQDSVFDNPEEDYK